MRIKKSWYDIIIGVCVLVFLGGFVAQLGPVPQDAKGYPIFLICASALLTAGLLAQAAVRLKREQAEAFDAGFRHAVVHLVIYSVMIGGYIFLLDKIGYILSSLLFVVGSLLYLKARDWRLLVLLPLGLTFSMYFLFTKFLMVTLPRGSWITFYL